MSKFITQLSYVGEECIPTLRLSSGEEYLPLGKTLGLSFDLTERNCIGWHDISNGGSYPCPEEARTDKKFETCPACQRRTGFNPAFYHTTAVSPQQEARNAEPHTLYLAYMGKNYIKVGISWSNRGTKRLLDQGARAGLILETFPTALIARQYESKIAELEGLHETTSTRTKLALLKTSFDKEETEQHLLATKQHIEEALSVRFSSRNTLFFDAFYTNESVPSGEITVLADPCISGKAVALVGDILITEYIGRTLALPLKQFIGYRAEFTDKILPLKLEPQQMQLF